MSSSKFYVNKTQYYVLEYLEEYGAAVKKVSTEKVAHLLFGFQGHCAVLYGKCEINYLLFQV